MTLVDTPAVLDLDLDRLEEQLLGPAPAPDEDVLPQPSILRPLLAVALPAVGAGALLGGIFIGVAPRLYGGVGGLAGVALAALAQRVRRPLTVTLTVVAGIVLIGLGALAVAAPGHVLQLHSELDQAVTKGSVLRPPVPFAPGWAPIVAWLAAIFGFGGAWLAVALDQGYIGLLAPVPLAVLAAVSTPKVDQVASGIVMILLFAIGLGVLSTGEGTEHGPGLGVGYLMRRLAKSIAYLAVATVVLVGLSRTGVLFPRPLVDPAHQAQLPRVAPLSTALDRVLFTVRSSLTGPWRLGSLDVYDGTSWRLPPYAADQIEPVPRSGVVRPNLVPAAAATFTMEGLTGEVLPALPNTQGIVSHGPSLDFDLRSDNIRLLDGDVTSGLSYTVVAAALPAVSALEADTMPLPPADAQFTRVPPAPPAVVGLLATVRRSNLFDEFNAARLYLLDHITASGAGTPVPVPPSRVQDMLAGSQEGSPYEIVAAQALVARWIGLASRIGYGFTGGNRVGGQLEVRPRDASLWVEVYFPGYGWLPFLGNPATAKPSIGGNPNQQQLANVRPSNNVAVNLFFPGINQPARDTARLVLLALALIGGVALLILSAYVLYPGVAKGIRRTRRRTAAAKAGPRTQIALAYAEWRDLITDFGYRHPAETPLELLAVFPDDAEHRALAWLVTRALWGDLAATADPALAAGAVELSRALRRRLAAAHPPAVRLVAVLSRLSLRESSAPELYAALGAHPAKEVTRALIPSPA